MYTKTMDMTNGKIMPLLLKFAFPIMLGSLFQHFYNLMDMSIAGYVIGDEAIASISATHAISTLITSTSLGFSSGCSILISQSFGAGNQEQTKRSFCSVFLLGALFSILLTGLLVFFLNPILTLIHVPHELLEQSKTYICIIIYSAFTTVFYNIFASSLRALGNSIVPLIFLIISSAINVLLDYLFMSFLHLGTAGAAWATAVAQACSVLLSFLYFEKSFPEYHFLREIKQFFDPGLLKEMSFLGISAAMTNSLFAIGSICVQSAVNLFGPDYIIAQAAAQKIESFCIIPSSGIANACASFTAQNHGAGKYNRIKQAAFGSVLFSLCLNLLSYGIIWFSGQKLLRLITNTSNSTVYGQGAYMLRIVIAFIFMQTVTMVCRMSIQSMKYKAIPLAGTFIELLARCFSSFILAPLAGFTGICLAEPLSWVISGFAMLPAFLYYVNQEDRRSV